MFSDPEPYQRLIPSHPLFVELPETVGYVCKAYRIFFKVYPVSKLPYLYSYVSVKTGTYIPPSYPLDYLPPECAEGSRNGPVYTENRSNCPSNRNCLEIFYSLKGCAYTVVNISYLYVSADGPYFLSI